MKDWLLYIVPITGLIGLAFGYSKAKWVSSQEEGTDRMKEIAGYIKEGAMAFLQREYKVLGIFVAVVAVLLALANGLDSDPHTSWMVGLSFVMGAACSALAGWIGMSVATDANVRTTNAARNDLNSALKVAFSGGTVMGMAVVGLAITGLSVLLLVYGKFGVIADVTTESGMREVGVSVKHKFHLIHGIFWVAPSC